MNESLPFVRHFLKKDKRKKYHEKEKKGKRSGRRRGGRGIKGVLYMLSNTTYYYTQITRNVCTYISGVYDNDDMTIHGNDVEENDV